MKIKYRSLTSGTASRMLCKKRCKASRLKQKQTMTILPVNMILGIRAAQSAERVVSLCII